MTHTYPPSTYAELHCLSNFSFLRAASQPRELVQRAAELGYEAIAITDECSVAGVVRAYQEAKNHTIRLIVGSEFTLTDGLRFAALAQNRAGYAALCTLITQGRRAAEKGSYRLTREDLAAGLPGCVVLWLPGEDPNEEQGRFLFERFGRRAWLAVELHDGGNDATRRRELSALGERLGLPLVATGGVQMHISERQPLADVLTAIRLGTTVFEAGYALSANREQYLRSMADLAQLYPATWLQESTRIAESCTFSLDELRYEYPDELVPSGETPASHLRRLTEAGAAKRWPHGTSPTVLAQIERELALIGELRYEPFFLTVHDIVSFARSRGILCQGRGSAANSTVCFCLGITEVDPALGNLLFERFISRERNEPPDIDVDFEHERREEVIQYIYAKYGRDRAALAATVISYRARSAVRDVGKALGFSLDQLDTLAKTIQWWDVELDAKELRAAGFEPGNPTVRMLLRLTAESQDFPRHLSQHVGGFVISAGPLAELVPIENATMADRTVIQWDKDDLEALGLLKVDVLGLGMLTAIRRCFEYIATLRGHIWTLATLPAEDPAVYAMMQRADTIGVFQIESRAQMAMLPRLKPVNFYDLVIEVSLVRPGPIQGDMVHPYLARRAGKESIEYPSKDVEQVLQRTLGVPIFQEQVMQLAVVAAGFTGGEADQLRRSMASWRRNGSLERFERKLKDGMRERGYTDEFAQRIWQQIGGFAEYGFPESHAASFALLVYASAWLKHHEPAVFLAAMLNSQPLGFYGDAQLVADARRHSVEVRPVDIRYSGVGATLESDSREPDTQPAVRLGLQQAAGLSAAAIERILAARSVQPFRNVQDLVHRAALDARDRDALVASGALQHMSGHRHRAHWDVAGVAEPSPLLDDAPIQEAIPLLARPSEGEDIVADYASLGLTLGRHPLALLRESLAGMQIRTAVELATAGDGSRVHTAGLVLTRQRPGGGNVTFVTLEDETGVVNVIVWPKLAERQRQPLLAAQLLAVSGRVQQREGVLHLIADGLKDMTSLLGGLVQKSRDFH